MHTVLEAMLWMEGVGGCGRPGLGPPMAGKGAELEQTIHFVTAPTPWLPACLPN